MADSRLTDGLLNLALAGGGILVIVLLYGFAARTLTPRTTPTRAAAAAESVVDNSRIKVEIRNAAGVDGLAAQATAHLRRRGFDVVEVGNAAVEDTSRVLVRSGTAVDARHVSRLSPLRAASRAAPARLCARVARGERPRVLASA